MPFWLYVLQSGTSDLDGGSRSSSVHSLSGESIPLARSANAELKVAIKHITEVSEEIHKNGKEIRKLLELQSKMEQQLHCIMQTLSSAQWQGGSELDGLKGEYQMCHYSLKLSKSDHRFQGESTVPTAPVAATMRRHSMPATLDCIPEERMDLIKQVRQCTVHHSTLHMLLIVMKSNQIQSNPITVYIHYYVIMAYIQCIIIIIS